VSKETEVEEQESEQPKSERAVQRALENRTKQWQKLMDMEERMMTALEERNRLMAAATETPLPTREQLDGSGAGGVQNPAPVQRYDSETEQMLQAGARHMRYETALLRDLYPDEVEKLQAVHPGTGQRVTGEDALLVKIMASNGQIQTPAQALRTFRTEAAAVAGGDGAKPVSEVGSPQKSETAEIPPTKPEGEAEDEDDGEGEVEELRETTFASRSGTEAGAPVDPRTSTSDLILKAAKDRDFDLMNLTRLGKPGPRSNDAEE